MRVLVAYASHYGSTQGIAERIAATLRQQGVEAIAQPVQHADDPKNYDAAVIGSAVYYFRWKQRALQFVQRNRDVLGNMPVWLFSSGPLGIEPKDAQGRDLCEVTIPKDIPELCETIKARDHRVFFGVLDPSKFGFTHRLMMKLPANKDNAIFPTGDFRNWADIDAWATGIAQALKVPQNHAA